MNKRLVECRHIMDNAIFPPINATRFFRLSLSLHESINEVTFESAQFQNPFIKATL